MPGDFEVRIGIAPEGYKWYLRFFADWDGDDKKIEGDFDVTLPPELAERFRTEVAPELPVKVVEEASETFYARIKS